MVCNLIPVEKRPQVLYAGNQAMVQRVKNRLDPLTTVHLAPNIRPTVALEDLSPVQAVLNQAICQIMVHHMPGLQELSGLVGSQITTTSMSSRSSTRR